MCGRKISQVKFDEAGYQSIESKCYMYDKDKVRFRFILFFFHLFLLHFLFLPNVIKLKHWSGTKWFLILLLLKIKHQCFAHWIFWTTFYNNSSKIIQQITTFNSISCTSAPVDKYLRVGDKSVKLFGSVIHSSAYPIF